MRLPAGAVAAGLAAGGGKDDSNCTVDTTTTAGQAVYITVRRA